MNKRAIIIGSGASLQEGLDKGLQDILRKEVTFSLNEEFRFFDSTVTMFGDWTFYKCRYELLENQPLIIGKWNRYIGNKDEKTGELYCPLLPQLIMLPSCSSYMGKKESWIKGFFTGVLTGLFTLTLAIALGFEEIFILGQDGKMINNKTHHYEGLEGFGNFVDIEGKPRTGVGVKKGVYNTGVFNKDRKIFNLDFWDNYKDELNRIKIYNVSVESTVDTFPKITYNEFISMMKNNPSNINQDLARLEIKKYIKENASFDKNNFYCVG